MFAKVWDMVSHSETAKHVYMTVSLRLFRILERLRITACLPYLYKYETTRGSYTVQLRLISSSALDDT
jgi:hypothetical protein